MILKRIEILIVCCAFFVVLPLCVFAQSQNRITIIRDTEIEDFLYEISEPIFMSARLDPKNIKFHIIQDNSINAFVMNGQNIFINTGTLTAFEDADAVLGIIAHETAHISGGHIAKIHEEAKTQQKVLLSSVLVGIGAAIASNPEAAQASLLGGMQLAQQNMLQYSRTQERSADQLAIRYLTDNGLSPVALLKSMKTLKRNELGVADNMEYSITHPLSKNRVEHIKSYVKKGANNDSFNRKYNKRLGFIKAKIEGYTLPHESVLKQNSEVNKSDEGIYAKSISQSLNGGFSESIKGMDYLIKKYPDNPYFLETKGNILFQYKKVDESIFYLRETNKKLPNKPLIKIALSLSIIKSNKEDLYSEAISHLENSLKTESNNLQAWKLLAEVYYKTNQKDKSYLCLAEYYLRQNNRQKTLKYSKKAQDNTLDASVLLRVEDVKKALGKKTLKY